MKNTSGPSKMQEEENLNFENPIKGNASNMPLKGQFKFPKKERLKSKKTIERLFAEGTSINAFPLKLIYLKTPLPQEVSFQIAVIAPKKHFKSAVARNRIKRLLREAYRLNKASLFNNTINQYALVILYLGKEMPSFPKINTGVARLFSKLQKQIPHEKKPN